MLAAAAVVMSILFHMDNKIDNTDRKIDSVRNIKQII